MKLKDKFANEYIIDECLHEDYTKCPSYHEIYISGFEKAREMAIKIAADTEVRELERYTVRTMADFAYELYVELENLGEEEV